MNYRFTRIPLAALCTVFLFPSTSLHAGSSRSAPPFAFTVRNVTQVAQLVGPTPSSPDASSAPSPHSINDTTRWGICGGDLGSVMVSGNTAYLALGDNYTTCPPGTGGPAGDLQPPDWRSNALGIIPHPGNFTHGLHITRWYSRNGKRASEVIPSQHNAGDCSDVEMPGCEITKIPTYGFSVDGRLYLAFMSVHHWGAAGQWTVNYSSLAMSSDGGKHWKVKSGKVWWGPKSNFAQVAVTPDPTHRYLLFYGIPGGRFGRAQLMRCPNTPQGVLNQHSYQYFSGMNNGSPRWSSSPKSAVTVASAPVGELSVIYDAGLKQWLMTYLQGGGDLVIRSATHYWGPWSRPATLATQTRFPGLYGAFMNARFVSNGGRTVYFDMSMWGPYSVFWMRATLARRPTS